MNEIDRLQVASAIDQVAAEILRRCIDQLSRNELSTEDAETAQSICHLERGNPALSGVISEYTRLVDAVTDGAFSAVLEAALSTKQ